MCGIVAMFSRNRTIPIESLHRATEALKHRGPDGQDIWVDPSGQVGLGHTRLMINDLSAKQPISSENENCHIIVNGEFYDFKSIRHNLEINGHRFKTLTDSEIALHMYEDRKIDCLDQLRGEFAFILWDKQNKTLFAARDRFGIKPLFYIQVNDILYLASEAKALFAAGIQSTWDYESVYQRIYTGSNPGRSLFKNIKQIPPGHFLLANKDGIKIHSYWDISYPRYQNTVDQISENECIEQSHHLLSESIRLRMEADVPVGYLLSGGIDSSTLLGVASSLSNKPLSAFTVGFNDPNYDESPIARQMAESVGANLTVLSLNEDDFADHFSESVWHGEGIQYNAHGTSRFLLTREIQKAGYKAVMGGEGADEGFLGYDWTILRSTQSGIIPRWVKLILKLLKPMNQMQQVVAQTSPLLARITGLFDIPNNLSSLGIDWLGFLNSIMDDKFLNQFQNYDPYRQLLSNFEIRKKLLGRESSKQMIYLWLRSIFVNYHLASDRLDMAHAVEVRLPFLDHKLFEFVSQIPISVLAKDGRHKHILREVGKKYVTHEIYTGTKQPFYAPPSALRSGNKLYQLTQDTLRGPLLKSIPFFDQAEVINVLDQLPNLDGRMRAALDPLLMIMVSMCFLHERFRL